MRFRRTIVLLVAFYVLASAATAYAECAWVLWEETFSSAASPTPRAWTIAAAFGTEAVCDQNMTEIMTRFVKNGHKARNNTTIEVVAPMETYWKRFVCLPDTVDPRGPRGK